MALAIARPSTRARESARLTIEQLFRLGKPRVVALVVFTAVIGMFMATPGLPPLIPVVLGTIGIGLVATAGAALNCLIEKGLDARMVRTRRRPLAAGELTSRQAFAFVAVVGGTGLLLLYCLSNPLTMWLALATFLGYAVIYTVILKPRTPQNIVIGGASGAMPPVLGWTAITGEMSSDALLLFLIIFAWTPPHFWALALYRKHDYARAGVPMLPVTHGARFTSLHILLYTIMLSAICVLPFATGMSGAIYVVAALGLNGAFLAFAIGLHVNYSNALARRTFRYSILYLSCLFAALLIDHYSRL